jgi:hypothetical protein
MADTVWARGYDWSKIALYDGWGDGVTEDELDELASEVIRLFEKTALRQGYPCAWFPTMSEVLGEAGGAPIPESNDEDLLAEWREEAKETVWAKFLNS